MAISNPALYAVVPKRQPAGMTPAKKLRTITEIKSEKAAEFKAKQAIDRASAVLDRLEARTELYSKQMAQLQKRKAAAVARAARIEDSILTRLIAAGLDKASGFHVEFATRNAPAALDVLNESLVPKVYWREKVVASIDKNAVKAALAEGIEIAGVRLTSKVSLIRK